MLSYQTLKAQPRFLRALTSLDPDEFETLLIPFEQAWEADVTKHFRHKKARKRRDGGGRKPHLVDIEDKLLFILFYFKVYPLQAVIAACFGMSQGRANEWIHKLSPILESALGVAQCLPERDPQNLEPVVALCTSVDFMLDGTERPVQRPSDPMEQKDQSSGKKQDIRSRTISSSTSKSAWCAT
jgi:hypothetical protein